MINLKILLKKFGTLYSQELGIDLDKKSKEEIFKWFLASLLFGARISETIAKRTYRTLEKYNLLTPQKILKAGWNFLVSPIMREGGYVRYDGKTSDELLKISKELIEKYNGDLNNLYQKSKDSKDLEKKLQEFYSVGPVTSRIFLRELRGIWKKADPDVGKYVKLAAKKLGLPSNLIGLKEHWENYQNSHGSIRIPRPAQICEAKLRQGRLGYSHADFRNLEVALLRLGKDFYWKDKKPPFDIYRRREIKRT